MLVDKLIEGYSIDIVHQDTTFAGGVNKFVIANNIITMNRGAQSILLLQHLMIEHLLHIFWAQGFKEEVLAISEHLVEKVLPTA